MNKQINVLVTGANGLLGTAFRNHWRIRRYSNLNVKFSVHYDVAKRDANDIVFDYLKMDNIDDVLKDIDVLINCVAFTNVNKAENDCWANEYLNAGCLKLLSEKCKEHNVFLIHFSTDFVYGEDNADCNFEDTNLNPINEYGKAKLKGEKIIQESGCKHIILRLSWLYSEFSPNFITTLIDKFIEDEKVCAISDMYSSLTYADDVVRDVFDIISLNLHEHSYNLTTHNVYNYHNNGYHSIYDVAKQIKNVLRSESVIKKTTYNGYNFSAPRVKNTASSVNRFETIFFTITDWYISLSQCIDRYLYLKNFNKK